MSLSTTVLTLLSVDAGEQLKNLLESKHLYQKTEIDVKGILAKVEKQAVARHEQERLSLWISTELYKQRFTLAQQQVSVVASSAPSVAQPLLTLVLQHVGLFCRKCQRQEAFAPVWHTDVTESMRKAGHPMQRYPNAVPNDLQIFCLGYQCQRCLGKPEVFIVRREGWRLELHGRSPIEHIEAPNYIPKPEAWIYRDAVIAFNSGKVLAALFYLRTFIEQFARRVTGLKGKVTGDEILDEYYKSFQVAMRDQMPSLREWYDKLSEALHSAREDALLFETAKTQIENHFDIRRAFHIPEKIPTVQTAEPTEVGTEVPNSLQ